jgi:hypothetical protein
MKFKKALTLLAPAVLLLAFSTSSFAGISPNGSFGFSISACCSLDGNPSPQGDILSATTITWFSGADIFINTQDATTFLLPNDFVGLFNGLGTLSPNSVTTNAVDSMDLAFGPTGVSCTGQCYTFTSSSELRTVSTDTRSISYYFLGMFHDQSGTYDDAAASLTLSFSQSAANASIQGGGTLSTPPVPFTGAPEPATMALFGSALVGISLIGRKRLSR